MRPSFFACVCKSLRQAISIPIFHNCFSSTYSSEWWWCSTRAEKQLRWQPARSSLPVYRRFTKFETKNSDIADAKICSPNLTHCSGGKLRPYNHYPGAITPIQLKSESAHLASDPNPLPKRETKVLVKCEHASPEWPLPRTHISLDCVSRSRYVFHLLRQKRNTTYARAYTAPTQPENEADDNLMIRTKFTALLTVEKPKFSKKYCEIWPKSSMELELEEYAIFNQRCRNEEKHSRDDLYWTWYYF